MEMFDLRRHELFIQANIWTMVHKHKAFSDPPRRHLRGEHRGEDFKRLQPHRLQQHRYQPRPIGKHGEGRIVGDVAHFSE